MFNVMAAQLNIGGDVCESSVIPFVVTFHKDWLTATPRVSAVTLPIQNARLGSKVNFAAAKIPSAARTPKMFIQCTSPGDGQTSCEVLLTLIE